MSKRICLAKITTAHGIKGQVKLHVYAEDPQSLRDYGPLFTSETGAAALKIILASQMNKFWLANIEGITDRTAAEKLRGTELWVDRDKLPAPKDGQHYHADLIGLPAQDENGSEIGKIVAVVDFGAGDLLNIQPPGASSFYLPFTNDYVRAVNEDSVTVYVPEGLR